MKCNLSCGHYKLQNGKMVCTAYQQPIKSVSPARKVDCVRYKSKGEMPGEKEKAAQAAVINTSQTLYHKEEEKAMFKISVEGNSLEDLKVNVGKIYDVLNSTPATPAESPKEKKKTEKAEKTPPVEQKTEETQKQEPPKQDTPKVAIEEIRAFVNTAFIQQDHRDAVKKFLSEKYSANALSEIKPERYAAVLEDFKALKTQLETKKEDTFL